MIYLAFDTLASLGVVVGGRGVALATEFVFWSNTN